MHKIPKKIHGKTGLLKVNLHNFFYNIIIKCRNVDKGKGGGADNVDCDFCIISR